MDDLKDLHVQTPFVTGNDIALKYSFMIYFSFETISELS